MVLIVRRVGFLLYAMVKDVADRLWTDLTEVTILLLAFVKQRLLSPVAGVLTSTLFWVVIALLGWVQVRKVFFLFDHLHHRRLLVHVDLFALARANMHQSIQYTPKGRIKLFFRHFPLNQAPFT